MVVDSWSSIDNSRSELVIDNVKIEPSDVTNEKGTEPGEDEPANRAAKRKSTDSTGNHEDISKLLGMILRCCQGFPHSHDH